MRHRPLSGSSDNISRERGRERGREVYKVREGEGEREGRKGERERERVCGGEQEKGKIEGEGDTVHVITFAYNLATIQNL